MYEDDKDAEILSKIIAGVNHETGKTGRSSDVEEPSEWKKGADIFVVNIDGVVGTGEKLEGECMDSVVQHSIIIIGQVNLYEDHTNVKMVLSPNGKHYKFGDNRAQGLSTVIVWMPVEESHVVDVAAEVINVEVPFLLRLYVMTRLKMVIYLAQDAVRSKAGGLHKSF